MYAPLLLATALALRAQVQHLPVHNAAKSIVLSHEAPQRVEDASLNMVAYCDASGQTWIMVTNASPNPLVVEWTLTANKPGYPPDSWSNVSRVAPTQFEGWMSPAPYLHLDLRYDVDGLPITKSIDASCSGSAGEGSGIGE